MRYEKVSDGCVCQMKLLMHVHSMHFNFFLSGLDSPSRTQPQYNRHLNVLTVTHNSCAWSAWAWGPWASARRLAMMLHFYSLHCRLQIASPTTKTATARAVGRRGGNELHVGVRFKKRLEAMRIQSIELPIAIHVNGPAL